MINKLLSAIRPKTSDKEDITAVWHHCHPHLVPLDHIKSASALENGEYFVFAHIRLAGGLWFEMGRIAFNPLSGRYFFYKQDRRALLGERSDLMDAPVDAVNARLWSASPTLINIEPTTRCNFNCWYCIGRHMKQDDIRLENFARMLDNFPQLKTIALVGEGEPLLHKDFFTMAGMAKARNIRVMIISNGSAFSQSVIKKLCETEVAYVSISIDSFDPETFATSRLEGDLNKIWQGIRRLRDYRDANGFQFPKIALKGTLFSHTIDQLPRIALEANAHGVEIFESFQPLNPMKSYVKIYPKNQVDQLDSINKVAKAIASDSVSALESLKPFAEFCREEGIDFFPSVNKNPIHKNCNETWLYSLLSGDVTPCCQIKKPVSSKWNIFEHSVEDILADPEYENIRFNLWNGIFPSYCEGCWKTR